MSDTTLPRVSRIALIAAAMLAATSVGMRVWRDQIPAAPAAQTAPPAPDVGAMISSLEARLKAKPDDADGWRMLGWSFFQTQRFGEAATAYARATKLAPGRSDLWSSLGEALVMAGSGDVPPDARAAFDKAIALDHHDPRARYFLGVAQDLAGDHKGAIDAWFALLRETPAGAPWDADVRRTIEQVGAKDHIDVADRLAALRPAPPATAPAPGVASAAIPGPTPEQMRAASAIPPGAQQQMIAGMVEKLAARLKANPGDVDGWIMLMRSRVTLGEQAQARDTLNAAIAANPGQADRLRAAARELAMTTG